MAETIPLDINEILSSFAAENAAVTQRAIIAEAGVKARDKVIVELRAENSRLEIELAAQAEESEQADDVPDFG